MADVFQSGRGGENCTVFNCPLAGATLNFNTPNGNVHKTTSAENQIIIIKECSTYEKL